MNSFLRLSATAFLTLTVFAASCQLRAETWQNGGNGLWSNPLNWDFGVPTSSSSAVFDVAGSTSVDLGGTSRDLFQLIFNSGAQGYTFSGNAGDALNFSSTGFIQANAGMVGPQLINSALKLNGGAFTITNDDTTKLLTLGGGISLNSGTADLLNVGGAGNTTINGVIASGAITGITKTGTGTLTLGGANAYTGTTTILGGAVVTSSNTAIGPSALVFGDGATSATGNLHVTENLTVGAVTVRNNDPTIASNISIDAGKTMTVTGAVSAGIPGLDAHNTRLVVSGPGTLTINTGSNVSFGSYGTGTNNVVTNIDLTGVGAFNSTSPNFFVSGAAAVSRPSQTTVLLSNTSNSIIANTLSISNSTGGASNGSTSRLRLGTGTNTINVDTINLGLHKATGILDFASTAPGSPGTLVLAGRNTAKTNFLIGSATSATGGGGTVDFRGHDVQVNAGTITLGQVAGSTNSPTGTLSFDTGYFSVDVLNMGAKSASGAGTANGVLNVGGGLFVVNNTFTMGSQVTAGSAKATVNLTGGTIISNVDILEGAGGASTTSTLTLNGGTLDMTGKNIGSATNAITTLNFQSGTLKNVNQINNGVGIAKTTAGTLNVTGTNGISGPIAVNEGTLNLASFSSFNLGAGNITVADGTTFGVAAFSTASSAVTTTGSFTLGSATGSTLNLTLAGNPSVPLLNFGGSFTTGGTNTINLAATSAISPGTYTLIDYTGSIGGAGFAGLMTGSMPLRTSGMLVNNMANSSVDITLSADSIRWDGGTSNVWNINTTNNWKLITAGTTTTYLEPSSPGEPVRFDDMAAGNFNVDVSTNVNPVSVTFDNSTNNYTLSGTGGLTTPTLTKLGTGTATISTTGALAISTIALNGTGAVVINRTDNPTLSSTLTGTGTLQKIGTNDLTLSGSSSGFTGTVDVAAGTLKLGSSTALGNSTTNVAGSATLDLNGQTLLVGAGGATLTGTGNITASTTGTLQLGSGAAITTNPIGGNATVSIVAGSGTATMTGGSNTYTGPTQLISGTLALSGGDNRLPTGTTLAFFAGLPASAGGAAATPTYTATLDVGATNQTISTFTIPGAGPGANANPTGANITFTGSGALTVNGDNLYIGIPASGTYTGTLTHSVNMSTLANFNFSNTTKNLAVHFSGSGSGSITAAQVATLTLASNNTIVAANLLVGDRGGSGGAGGGTSTLNLGTNNVLNIGTDAASGEINVGFSARSNANVQFAAGLTNPSVTIRGFGGGNTPLASFRIGLINNSGDTRAFTDSVDLTAGSVDALVTTMLIGQASPSTNRNGTTNASFAMGAGTLTVGDLKIGSFLGGSGSSVGTSMAANGTFTLGTSTASGLLNATTINLAENITQATGGTRDVSGTLAIVNGTAKATTIQMGAQGGTATATARVDFTGGSIENYTGSNMAVNDVNVRMLATTGTPTVNVTGSNTTTFNAGTVVSDVGTLYKSGTGTLIFQGVNTHGGTIVNAGRAKVEGAGTFTSVGHLGTNGGGIADVNGTDQTVGALDGNGGNIINSVVATNKTLTVGGGDDGGGEYLGNIVGNTLSPTGDYNGNGIVDAADFALWRNDPASYGGTPDGYNTWRANFGGTATAVGDFTLVKTGFGEVAMSGTNTYTGTTTISAGALAFGKPTALYNNQPANWNNTKISVAANATIGFGVGGVGSFTEGQIQTYMANASSGMSAGSSIGIRPAVASYTYTSVIGDSAVGMTGLSKLGPNTLVLNQNNTYTGNTHVYDGVLSVATIGNIVSGPGPLGTPVSAAQAAIRLGSAADVRGTLRYTGAGETTNRDFLAWGGAGANGGIESSGTGALVLTGNLYSANAGAKTLTLGGTNTGGNKVMGTIFDSADVVSLAKTGAGAWELPTANTYTGLTRVVEGTLKITGSHTGGSDYDIGDTTGLTATAILDGASASVSILDDLHVGYNGSTGTFTMNDGSLTVPDDFRVGVNGGTGTFTMHNGTTTSGDNVIIGLDDGTGFFTMNNGSFTTSNNSPIQIGYEPGDTGTFTFNGGTINCDDWVVIGTFGGTGHGFQNGGTINCEPFVLAQSAGAVGDYTMTAGSISASDVVYVGQGGSGTLTLSGGNISSTNWTVIGRENGSNGQMVAGGTGAVNVGDNLVIGNLAGSTGLLTIQDDAVVTLPGNVPAYTGNVVVGETGNGTLNMTSGTLDLTTGATGTNNSISYAVAQANATLAQDGNISIGEGGGTGVASFTGDALVNVAANVIVGGAITGTTTGTGTLTVGGTAAVHVGLTSPTGGDLIIGSPSASTGTVNLQGGVLDVAHTDGTNGGNIASGGSASTVAFNFTGGTLKVRTWNAVGPTAGNLGNLVQNGAGSVLDVTGNDTTLMQSSKYNLGAGTATIGDGRTLTTNGILDSAGAGVIHVGQGGATATLTAGTNSIVVDTLNLNNGVVTAGGGINVATALTGNGTFNNDAAMGIGASVSPGLSAGSLSFTNNFSLSATGTLLMEIGGSTPITTFDKINVGAFLTTGGALQINLINGFVPTAGQAFDILDFVGIGGSFATVPSPANWDTTDLYTLGVVKFVALGSGSGLDGGPVPEPANLALLGVACFGLLGRRRRRSRA